ncbi:MAG: universal stress protein [Lysobacterales bacterium]|nr:MAG: universal stress protein [Xanthomonadales bacterium]
MFKTILCPIDGSDHANKALALAIDLARRYDARLRVLHVLLRNVDAPELKRFAEIEGLSRTVASEINRLMGVDSRAEIVRLRDLQTMSTGVLVDIAEHIVAAAKVEAENKGVGDVSVAVLDGDPTKRILEYAGQEHADCIVMGSLGLSDITALLLGSVSQKVSYLSACTCIAVK